MQGARNTRSKGFTTALALLIVLARIEGIMTSKSAFNVSSPSCNTQLASALQVVLGRNEEWPPLELRHQDLPSDLLDGLASGIIHLHVYTTPSGSIPDNQLRELSRWSHPSAASVKARHCIAF